MNNSKINFFKQVYDIQTDLFYNNQVPVISKADGGKFKVHVNKLYDMRQGNAENKVFHNHLFDTSPISGSQRFKRFQNKMIEVKNTKQINSMASVSPPFKPETTSKRELPLDLVNKILNQSLEVTANNTKTSHVGNIISNMIHKRNVAFVNKTFYNQYMESKVIGDVQRTLIEISKRLKSLKDDLDDQSVEVYLDNLEDIFENISIIRHLLSEVKKRNISIANNVSNEFDDAIKSITDTINRIITTINEEGLEGVFPGIDMDLLMMYEDMEEADERYDDNLSNVENNVKQTSANVKSQIETLLKELETHPRSPLNYLEKYKEDLGIFYINYLSKVLPVGTHLINIRSVNQNEKCKFLLVLTENDINVVKFKNYRSKPGEIGMFLFDKYFYDTQVTTLSNGKVISRKELNSVPNLKFDVKNSVNKLFESWKVPSQTAGSKKKAAKKKGLPRKTLKLR